MTILKPMLASDYDESKLRFPLIAQPKIDGVRGLCQSGKFTGRSLKSHGNMYTTALYSKPQYDGFDGELAADRENHPALCRLTTSAISTIEGEPYTVWHLFDFATPLMVQCGVPYIERFKELERYVRRLPDDLAEYLRVVPYQVCQSLSELLELDDYYLDQGYEGTIVRDPNGRHKQGRSTVREGGLLRIKRFIEEEAIVLFMTEAETNNNEATINALGHTERSSHQANKSKKGMIGNLHCRFVKSGEPFICGPGQLTHDMRTYYWNNPKELVHKIIKVKHFPKGVKDKPRFPTFVSFRADSDISQG